MPIYEYSCDEHGVFECYKKVDNCSEPEQCPECSVMSPRIISNLTIKVVQGAKRLPLGSGSAGKKISSKETGGMGIFIPSFGALEQAEVDYLAEGAVEKEKSRIKKKTKRINQAIVQSYVNLANRTPRGQKAKTIRKTIKETAG